MTDRHSPIDLEHKIGALLRQQPPLHAPTTLSNRVIDRLTMRASLPWWRREFQAWPRPARIAMVVAWLEAIQVIIALDVGELTRGLGFSASALTMRIQSVGSDAALHLRVVDHLGAALVHGIPTAVTYALLACGVLGYLTIIGASSLVYRSLNAHS